MKFHPPHFTAQGSIALCCYPNVKWEIGEFPIFLLSIFLQRVVSQTLIKKPPAISTENIHKNDIITEIKELDSIINQYTSKAIREDWIKACDRLNAIKDSKLYWRHFSRLVGNFKQKVYSDLKLHGKTATMDQERADIFADHMENMLN